MACPTNFLDYKNNQNGWAYGTIIVPGYVSAAWWLLLNDAIHWKQPVLEAVELPQERDSFGRATGSLELEAKVPGLGIKTVGLSECS